jgi:twitching motility protein PilJ
MKFQWAYLSRLKLAQKFMLLGAVATVLVAFPTIQFFRQSQAEVEFARTENRGLAPSRKLIDLARLLAAHRGLSNAFLSGAENLSAQRSAKAGEVAPVLTAIDDEMSAITEPRIRESWAAIRKGWQDAVADVDGRRVDGRSSFENHTAVIKRTLQVIDQVADHYKLTLDPDFHTYYLIQVSVIELPFVNEDLGQLRGFGAGRLAAAAKARAEGKSPAEAITANDRARLAALVSSIESRWSRVQANFDKVHRDRGAIAGELKQHAERSAKTLEGVLTLARRELLETAAPSLESGDYFRQVTVAIDEKLKLTDEALALTQSELDAKVAELRRAQLLLLAAMAATVALGAAVSLFIVRSVTRPVANLTQTMTRLQQGDDDARAEISGRDEMGQMAYTFNSMMDERVALQQRIKADQLRIEKENETLNNSVLGLLQTVSQMARKDLTVRATVTEDVTGPVADALNLVNSETVKVLQQVSDISADVSLASLKVKQQSDSVQAVAEAERVQVHATSESLVSASQAMSRIADLAQTCNAAADRAIKTTQAALASVTSTVGGIASTRDTIRETEKRIKRLGERSQEISVAVNLINTIAERTHILALNAAMHAASAGEAGRGFAVVADEVQRLAESARQATQQIATLVGNIQVETADTVTTMNSAISQVVEGSKLAEQAGAQMQITQETTSELVASVQRIAAQSQEQAAMSKQLIERAEQSKQSSIKTNTELAAQAEQTGRLVEYAKTLLSTVRVFKLTAG